MKDIKSTVEEACPNGLEKLEGVCLGEVIESVERQIKVVPYFRNESANNVDTTKLDSVPLTNLGCE